MPAASSNPRTEARGKALRRQVLAEETDCHLCGEPVDKNPYDRHG